MRPISPVPSAGTGVAFYCRFRIFFPFPPKILPFSSCEMFNSSMETPWGTEQAGKGRTLWLVRKTVSPSGVYEQLGTGIHLLAPAIIEVLGLRTKASRWGELWLMVVIRGIEVASRERKDQGFPSVKNITMQGRVACILYLPKRLTSSPQSEPSKEVR